MSATAALTVPIDDADERAVTNRAWNGGRWFAGPAGVTWSASWRCCSPCSRCGSSSSPRSPSSASLSNQKLWPESFTLRQYHKLIDGFPYWQWFVNSLVISTVTATFTVLLAASAAFPFSRMRFRGRRAGLLSLLLIQMFPASLAFVAIYIMVQHMSSTFEYLGAGSAGHARAASTSAARSGRTPG